MVVGEGDRERLVESRASAGSERPSVHLFILWLPPHPHRAERSAQCSPIGLSVTFCRDALLSHSGHFTQSACVRNHTIESLAAFYSYRCLPMANPDSENAVGQLKNSPSPAEQLAALKHLKNQIIGHPEKKETLVQHGLIDVLAQVLSNCVKTGSSQRDQSANGSETPQASNGSASSAPAHDVHLQALHLIRSLAQGQPIQNAVHPLLYLQ